MPPLPDLVLYARPGCSLCDEAREAIRLVIEDRQARDLPVPEVSERDIEADPDLHRRYLERIPIVELGDQRIELIVTVGKLRRLLQAFDGKTLRVSGGSNEPRPERAEGEADVATRWS